ncbi:MAG: prepilin-type N-terminal cleavage/methylation domain-containing protein [Dehalococcoidales bacterium]
MKSLVKRMHRREQGFTLVELLIVFTLLGVLAAIVIPSVAGLVNYGHTQSGSAELSIIQTAMDSMMARENLSTVAPTTNTTNMAAFPSDHPLYKNYLRFPTSKGYYTTDNVGLVSLVSNGYDN